MWRIFGGNGNLLFDIIRITVELFDTIMGERVSERPVPEMDDATLGLSTTTRARISKIRHDMHKHNVYCNQS